jgi:hypothetical protein
VVFPFVTRGSTKTTPVTTKCNPQTNPAGCG